MEKQPIKFFVELNYFINCKTSCINCINWIIGRIRKRFISILSNCSCSYKLFISSSLNNFIKFYSDKHKTVAIICIIAILLCLKCRLRFQQSLHWPSLCRQLQGEDPISICTLLDVFWYHNSLIPISRFPSVKL